MKIIDLLNKIANEEEVPIKFTYKGYLWEYDVKNKMWFYYFGEGKNHRFDRLFYLNNCLNDEVEILEEEKKTKPSFKKDIEALGYACGEIQKCFTNGWTKSLENKPLKEEKKIPEKLPYYSMEKIQKAKNKDEWREERITLLEKRIDDYHIKMNDLLDYLKSKGDE